MDSLMKQVPSTPMLLTKGQVVVAGLVVKGQQLQLVAHACALPHRALGARGLVAAPIILARMASERRVMTGADGEIRASGQVVACGVVVHGPACLADVLL